MTRRCTPNQLPRRVPLSNSSLSRHCSLRLPVRSIDISDEGVAREGHHSLDPIHHSTLESVLVSDLCWPVAAPVARQCVVMLRRSGWTRSAFRVEHRSLEVRAVERRLVCPHGGSLPP